MENMGVARCNCGLARFQELSGSCVVNTTYPVLVHGHERWYYKLNFSLTVHIT